MLLPSRLEHYVCAADYRKTVALGFRPRHRTPLARPRANDSASSSLNSVSLLLRSAFASSVSPPCLCCGWLAPRLIVSSFLAPWYLHTAMPYAAGFRQRSPRALQVAVQRRVLPEVMFGRAMVSVFLHYISRSAHWTGTGFFCALTSLKPTSAKLIGLC
jgi:hypothetical protein